MNSNDGLFQKNENDIRSLVNQINLSVQNQGGETDVLPSAEQISGISNSGLTRLLDFDPSLLDQNSQDLINPRNRQIVDDILASGGSNEGNSAGNRTNLFDSDLESSLGGIETQNLGLALAENQISNKVTSDPANTQEELSRDSFQDNQDSSEFEALPNEISEQDLSLKPQESQSRPSNNQFSEIQFESLQDSNKKVDSNVETLAAQNSQNNDSQDEFEIEKTNNVSQEQEFPSNLEVQQQESKSEIDLNESETPAEPENLKEIGVDLDNESPPEEEKEIEDQGEAKENEMDILAEISETERTVIDPRLNRDANKDAAIRTIPKSFDFFNSVNEHPEQNKLTQIKNLVSGDKIKNQIKSLKRLQETQESVSSKSALESQNVDPEIETDTKPIVTESEEMNITESKTPESSEISLADAERIPTFEEIMARFRPQTENLDTLSSPNLPQKTVNIADQENKNLREKINMKFNLELKEPPSQNKESLVNLESSESQILSESPNVEAESLEANIRIEPVKIETKEIEMESNINLEPTPQSPQPRIIANPAPATPEPRVVQNVSPQAVEANKGSSQKQNNNQQFSSGFNNTNFEDGGDGAFQAFDLDNFIEKPQNHLEERLDPAENLDLKKKVPVLNKFPTFSEFLKNGALPEIPGLDLPRSLDQIKNSDQDQEELSQQLKRFLLKGQLRKANVPGKVEEQTQN